MAEIASRPKCQVKRGHEMHRVLAPRRHEPWWRLVGLLPGFGGVGLIAWQETSGTHGALPPSMIALLLVSAFAWALGTVYVQRHAAHVPADDLAGMQLICGGAGLLLLSAASGEWSAFAPRQITATSLAGVLYLGLLASVVGNTVYLWLIDRMSAPVVATHTFVNPVIAIALGVLVLGKRITWPSLAGGALVIGSLVALLCGSHVEELTKAGGKAPWPNSAERSRPLKQM